MKENGAVTFILKIFYLGHKTKQRKSKPLSQHKPDYQVKGKAYNLKNTPSFK